jgi:hypothetical protein
LVTDVDDVVVEHETRADVTDPVTDLVRYTELSSRRRRVDEDHFGRGTDFGVFIVSAIEISQLVIAVKAQ